MSRLRRRRPSRLVTAALGLALAGSQAVAQPANPNDWLLNAPDDRARFRALQEQAGGFHVSMLAVGQRYQAMYDALGEGNHQLAAYQWEKIRELIQTGYARRPRRQPSADREFLGKVYEPVLAALRSGDAQRAWAGFAEARTACMACHDAERVGFMNQQALFRRTANPPRN
jgi:cytochrome c553